MKIGIAKLTGKGLISLHNRIAQRLRFHHPQLGGSGMILKLAAVSAAIMMAGCSVTLPVIALSGQGPEIFTGNATAGGDGRGTLNLRGTRSGVLCYGAFMYTRRTGGAGAKGIGDAECDDGRKVRFDFFAQSATVGTGSGYDSRDMPFFFTYGMTEAETLDAFAKRFPAQASQPADNPRDKAKLLGV